jgi:hypothetical protein
MRLLLVIILIAISGFCVQAQTVKPIRWTFSLSKNEIKQGEFVEIIMKAEISADWYLYSSDFDPSLGPTVTSVSFENNNSFKTVGSLKAVNPKEKYDSLWEGKVRYFIKYAEFRQRIKVLTTKPVLKGLLMYQVCSDKEGKCIPYEENLLFDKLKVSIAEVLPEKQQTSDTPKTVEKTPETPTNLPDNSSTSSKDRLSALESEKKKLIEKDNKGNDVAVEQLKEFVQKYGGDK